MATRGHEQGVGGHADREQPRRALVIGRLRPGHEEVTEIVREVERLLAQESRLSVESEIVRRKRDVRASALRGVTSGCELVIAVGGDGTVLQVVNSLAGSQVALGIVPTGTGNLLAGNLGIPSRLPDAVKVAVAGRPRRIDAGRFKVKGKRRAFAVACGVGFDAEVMQRTTSEQKARWGMLAYLASAFRETANIRNIPHEITLDGVRRTTEAAQVLIANFGRVPPGLHARGVKADDGLLDVFIVRASGPLPGLLAGWEAIRQTGMGESAGGRVFRARARNVRIDCTPSRRVEADGSVIGRTPVTISIRPAALTVMVPRR